MIQFQHQLRYNTQNVQDYVSDLKDFKSDMDKKEKNRKVAPKAAPVQKKKLPPIRNKVDITDSYQMGGMKP
jgi:hypothetical protein